MRTGSNGRPGRRPMTEKRELYVRLIRQGISNAEACRQLEIDRKTGHWWKNGGVYVRNGVTRVVEPILNSRPVLATGSLRYLSEDERITIADGVRAGRSARTIAAELGRAVSTVARELQRNRGVDGEYRPHAAQAKMRARQPRPKHRRLSIDAELRQLVQRYLDQRWSPEQIAHVLSVEHGERIAVETIYQALYSPQRVLQRDAQALLRTHRPHRRPRRRGDQRRGRFVVPLRMTEERPADALDRGVAGHWESQCCCQAAIGMFAWTGSV